MSYSWDNKFSSEQTHSWKGAISKKSNGSEGINNCVQISQSLQTFQLSTIAIPKGTMTTKENFN